MGFDDSLMASLSELALEAERPVVAATEAEVAEAARLMAATGYDFRRSPNALDALRHYLNGRSLFLCGSFGTGKTSFFKALRDSGVARHGIAFYSLGANGDDYENKIVDDMRELDGYEVVVDDVGCESDWGGRRLASDIIFRILSVRENSPHGLRTHITSNKERKDIHKYDGRVLSRLRMFEVVPFVGEDNRAPCVNEAEAARRRKCADPSNWVLCAERCTQFVGGRCLRGLSVPPVLVRDGGTPESVCGVGEVGGIPYRAEHLEAERRLRERSRALSVKYGLPITDYLREVGR